MRRWGPSVNFQADKIIFFIYLRLLNKNAILPVTFLSSVGVGGRI
jgi:hypothetical protein